MTVWGAGFQLRSETHRTSVGQGDIVLRGIIAKTTLPDAPKCSVHATGIADPYDCRAEVPAFWLCDRQGDPIDRCIKVMGWASNNAQIFDALRKYDNDASATVVDNFWGVALPNPLPTVGADVQVYGIHSRTFTMSSAGAEENEFMGVLTAHEIVTVVEGPELATLPGVKRNPKQ